ncbi:Verru_Chthon cassette protein A [Verrucomicrobium sp. BvORR034]|uniref:Verru_Chthon cassette protein A n=1 Tax=Verrucomicrobium sp. BvORR034 TaxID=1396418 RepID=UPI0006786687|nr:Verru_Chthon cassette protein A [Verrucomicrobium sp. BvORR034]
MKSFPNLLKATRAKMQTSGVALVLVLSSLVMVSLLVLVFLSTARTEQQSSAAFADSTQVRNLAEVPINLAVGQLRKATEQLGGQRTWASQPGMIRVFGVEDDGSGFRSKATALYKLYSDDTMVVAKAGATPTTGGLTPAEVKGALESDVSDLVDWNTKAGLYVDLNEPVPVTSATSTTPEWEFPIVDPRAMQPEAGGQTLAVDGFSYAANGVPGAILPTSRTDANARLPLPVKWLYILQDGSIAPPTGVASGKVTFGAAAPTALNPIVGRVAFWTDDETSKVNINTALEGVPWETPHTTSPRDVSYAKYMPARNEFSRYPGHPAQTSLSTVFQAFGPSFIISPSLAPATLAERMANLHRISPRYAWGGTLAGTTKATTAILENKTDRLYATLDELVYDRNRALNAAGELDGRDLAIGKFFLTTNSRSPELTPFNKPKVGLWPVSQNTKERNEMDRLMVMLMSGGVEGGGSRTEGWMIQRRENAKVIDGIVGSGHTTWQDFYKGGRNESVFGNYLVMALGKKAVGKKQLFPGFGGGPSGLSFDDNAKYGEARRDQILTEMLDLTRWGVNTENTTGKDAKEHYKYLPPHQDPTNNPSRRAESSAAPLIVRSTGEFAGFNSSVSTSYMQNTKGFGRFPTISEATFVFQKTQTNKFRAFFLIEPFVPSCGPPAFTANYRYRVLFNPVGDSFTVKSPSGVVTSLGLPVPANAAKPDATFDEIRNNWPVSMVNFPTDILFVKSKVNADGGNTTPFAGMMSQFKQAMWQQNNLAPDAVPLGKTGNNNTPGNWSLNNHAAHANFYPFYGAEITHTSAQTEFEFSGGEVVIAMYLGWTGEDKHLPTQRIHIRFPKCTLPIPTNTVMTLATRFSTQAPEDMRDVIILPNEVSRSVEINPAGPAKGDLRVNTALAVVPEDYFAPSPGYFDKTIKQNHGLRDGAWMTEPQIGGKTTRETAGNLLKGVNYPDHAIPAVTRGVDGAFNKDGRPGDWDTGIGGVEDGPYVNKPDEGTGALPLGGYFSRGGKFASEDGTTFSPNRMISSAVAFGSLPTGIAIQSPAATNPWQTLLFCPNPAARTTPAGTEPSAADHLGFATPRDHLLLDLFYMPVIEPYAISDSFSTAGKINMNYQMMPFTYVERSTGMHAALKSTRITAIPVSEVNRYKAPVNVVNETPGNNLEFRYTVNTTATLSGIKQRFTNWDVYRSPSEICEIFLVPQRIPGGDYGSATVPPTTYEAMNEWWNGSANTADAMDLTGDNLREAPYGQLYPRLATQSNTYTVHYRVQTLKKARSSDAAGWEEGKDAVTAEYRGSAMLERYLDPNEKELGAVGLGGDLFVNSWDAFFRFRVIQNKQFAR